MCSVVAVVAAGSAYAAAVALVALGGPLWLRRWQRCKKPLRGPWDLGGSAGLAGDEWKREAEAEAERRERSRDGDGDGGDGGGGVDGRRWDMADPKDRADWEAFMRQIRCD